MMSLDGAAVPPCILDRAIFSTSVLPAYDSHTNNDDVHRCIRVYEEP